MQPVQEPVQRQSQSEVAPSQEPVHLQSEEVEAEDVRITHQTSAHLCECPIVLDDEEDQAEDDPLLIDVDDDDQQPRITQVEGLTSETVQEITLERDPQEEEAQKKEKLTALKRKLIPSRE